MGRDLSEACLWDRDRDCQWAGCQCRCHEDQIWDWMDGWRERDEEGR